MDFTGLLTKIPSLCGLYFLLLFSNSGYIIQAAKAVPSREGPKCGYDICDPGKPDMLNVHMVAHTHDDVGWLKTINGYFYGDGSRPPFVVVKAKIDNVIQSLKKDPNRRFIYVEMAFFTMWWREQTEEIKSMVKDFVNTGRLEFISGAWCMNDEGTTHYNAIIDQFTLGLKFLKDTFGDCAVPRVAWQIDPFGHSREQAALSAQFGFDGLFFGRLDYQDKKQRMDTKTAELVWMASKDLGDAGSLFTSVIHNLYWPPEGVRILNSHWFSKLKSPRSQKRAEEEFKKFIDACNNQAKDYSTNHIMMTIGGDFQFQHSEGIFQNIDTLISYVNSKQKSGTKINVFYSTPTCYLKALNNVNQTYTAKYDDFFPYAHKPSAFWTGYFTSRPTLKRYVRESNNFLQICKQMETLSGLHRNPELKTSEKVDVLREAVAVVQHHDGVSGTEKQHVAHDYELRLANGTKHCQEIMNMGYQALLPLTSDVKAPRQEYCPGMNISVCNVTTKNDNFTITIYNPIARPITYWVRVPVDGKNYTIIDPYMSKLDAYVIPNQQKAKWLASQHYEKASKYLLTFKAELPPLGFSTFFVHKVVEITKIAKKTAKKRRSKNTSGKDAQEEFSIQNEHIKLTYSKKDNLLKSITNLEKDITVKVQHELLYYESCKGYFNGVYEASGAYIFRPQSEAMKIPGGNIDIIIEENDILKEVHTIYNKWAHMIHRLYKGERFVEIEWTIGPLPSSDNIGKEVISRFTTDLHAYRTFYTDSNGRGYIKRVIDYRETWNLNQSEPVAGNYYPINSKISLRDDHKNIQLTVVTDRSHGGGSIKDGEMEIMLHRRMFRDDGLGVAEPLDESGVNGKGLIVKGWHRLFLDRKDTAEEAVRNMEERLYMAPSVTFAALNMELEDYRKKYNTEWNGLKNSLPENVHLLTLETWGENIFLLRLEHYYGKEQSETLSKDAKVSLQEMFSIFDVESVEELTLVANQKLKDAKRMSWNVQGYGRTISDMETFVKPVDHTMIVELKPMQIRTFKVKVKSRPSQIVTSKLVM